MPKRNAAALEAADDDDNDENENDARPQKASHRKAGFKDAKLLCATLAPYIKKRHDINYTSDRNIKAIQRNKLSNKLSSTDPVRFVVSFCTFLRLSLVLGSGAVLGP